MVSSAGWNGKDMPPDLSDRVTDQAIKLGTKLVVMHGHGETTMLADWQHKAAKLLDASIALSICSNLSKNYTDTELQTLARFKHLAISIDTVDVGLFKKLRRGGDVRHVIYNMTRIQSIAKDIGNPISISWSIVCCDQTIWHLEQLVRFGISLGVHAFTFCNLSYHDMPRDVQIKHVSELSVEQCKQALVIFENIESMCKQQGCKYDPKAGLIDTIINKCSTGNTVSIDR
jgi:hypothetical protein